ncbi:MAG: DnaA/Hda family protein [Desulfitobacterium sp.]
MIWLSSDFNRMAENILNEYSPARASFSTLIYGPAGVGKSELLLQCFKRLKNQHSILYLDAQDFIKSYAFSAQEGTLAQFRHRVRTPAVLIIDHLELLKGKAHSIEEFYHTYEALFQGDRKMICGFQGEPSQLDILGHKLASRLRGGLAVPIGQPNREDILNYLYRLAHAKYLILEEQVLETLAKEIHSFREAQNLLKGFIEYANRMEGALDKEALTAYLIYLRNRDSHRPTPHNIIRHAANITGTNLDDIYGTSRVSQVREARALAIYGMRSLCQLSYPEIGLLLNKAHSSVMKSYQQVQDLNKKNPEICAKTKMFLEYFEARDDVNFRKGV